MNPKPSPNPIEHSVRQAMATPDASPAFVEQLQAQIYAHAAAQYHPNGRQLAFRTALWLAGVVVLAAAFALLLTPQGRVLAQSLLQFFTQASGDTRALPTAQAPVLVAITPGNERPTPVAEESHPAFFAQCGDLPAPRCSLDEIRRLAQFEVKALNPAQPGLHFIGASGAPDTVFLVYGRADDPGLLVLYEMPRSQPFPPLEVGANAVVEKVQVGSADGEYVNGFWIHADLGQKETWQEDAGAQTLRWEDGQLFYQLSLFGPAEGAQPSKNDLVALAENLSATSPLVTPDPDHLLSLQAARTVADFEVVEPANIPADYQFDFARAVKDGACLIYQNL
ncbi:MAG: hypothetical protein GYA59_01730, partial [Chloroflexi bacterium]|nr:hypothetical protein [Chloroflexota bacterium]